MRFETLTRIRKPESGRLPSAGPWSFGLSVRATLRVCAAPAQARAGDEARASPRCGLAAFTDTVHSEWLLASGPIRLRLPLAVPVTVEVPSQVASGECGAGAWDPACATVARGLRLINLNPASDSVSESDSESGSRRVRVQVLFLKKKAASRLRSLRLMA